jgi:hypothetical protein
MENPTVNAKRVKFTRSGDENVTGFGIYSRRCKMYTFVRERVNLRRARANNNDMVTTPARVRKWPRLPLRMRPRTMRQTFLKPTLRVRLRMTRPEGRILKGHSGAAQ